MARRDNNSMDVKYIDGLTGKTTTVKAGSGTSTTTPGSTTPVKSTIDWTRLVNIPVASEDQTGVVEASFFSQLKAALDKLDKDLTTEDVTEAPDKKYISDDLLQKLIILISAHSHAVTSAESIAAALSTLSNGDTVDIDQEIDLSATALTFSNVEVALNLKNDIITANNNSDGVAVTSGKVTLQGAGKIVTNTPYGSGHASGIINVQDSGELVFDGSGISAVMEDDPVNKGQFGVSLFGDTPSVTVNAGELDAGWYCLTGNGAKTGAGAVMTINGGVLRSIADYAIYHPHAGTLNINGGVIYGAAGAVSMNAGTINVTGGELTSDNTGNTGTWNDGTSGQSCACLYLEARYGDVVVNISGGKFTTANGDLFVVGTEHTVTITITGGQFNVKPDASWIADGYACSEEKNEDGYYIVTKVEE